MAKVNHWVADKQSPNGAVDPGERGECFEGTRVGVLWELFKKLGWVFLGSGFCGTNFLYVCGVVKFVLRPHGCLVST